VRRFSVFLFGSCLDSSFRWMASGQSSQPEAQVQSATSVEADAKTDGKAEATLKEIRARGKSAPAKTRAAVEKKLDQISGGVDANASAKGKEVAAGRIAPEFGMTGEALLAEETQFNTSLGQLVIAHSLLANAKTPGDIGAAILDAP